MNETIKLTKAQERALRIAQSSHVKSLFEDVHGNTINALVRRGLLVKEMKDLSGWTGIGYRITEDGIQYLQELDGMGGGGTSDDGLEDWQREAVQEVMDILNEDEQTHDAAELLEIVVQELAGWQRYKAEVDAEYKAEFEGNAKLKVLEEKRAKARERVETLEATLRDSAIAQFNHNGDKHPHPKVEIKMMTVIDYDPLKALHWAQDNARYLLVLDTRQFEKTMRGVVNVPQFVTRGEQPKAFIAKDLS